MFSLSTPLATILGLCAILSSAQTPPGYSPATNTHLTASFGALNISPPGLRIPLNTTKTQPTIHLPASSNSTSKSLLLMIDLDAPYASLNRSFAPYLHWLQPDLSFFATTNSSTPAVAPYVNPAPPAGSPEHRYVILAFSQPSSSAPFAMPKGWEGYGKGEGLASNRTVFDVGRFAAAAGLGGPVAADWFTVVPEVQNSTTVAFQGAAAGGRTAAGYGATALGVAVLVGLLM